jgi:hypothetical protein
MTTVDCESLDNTEAGAPADDYEAFEITEERLDRAVDALVWLDTNDGNPKGIVKAILVAMGATEIQGRLLLRKRK